MRGWTGGAGARRWVLCCVVLRRCSVSFRRPLWLPVRVSRLLRSSLTPNGHRAFNPPGASRAATPRASRGRTPQATAGCPPSPKPGTAACLRRRWERTAGRLRGRGRGIWTRRWVYRGRSGRSSTALVRAWSVRFFAAFFVAVLLCSRECLFLALFVCAVAFAPCRLVTPRTPSPSSFPAAVRNARSLHGGSSRWGFLVTSDAPLLKCVVEGSTSFGREGRTVMTGCAFPPHFSSPARRQLPAEESCVEAREVAAT